MKEQHSTLSLIHAEQENTKPTLMHLYREHMAKMNTELFEIPDVHPMKVLYLFFYGDATQQDAERILACFNRLAQTSYQLDDIAGITFLSDKCKG